MKIKVEIADTTLTLAKGLMGRKTMAPDEGMLFKFPAIIEARFWGKDTYYSTSSRNKLICFII